MPRLRSAQWVRLLGKVSAGCLFAALILGMFEVILRLAGFTYRPRQKTFDLISTLYEVGTRELYRHTYYVKGEFLWLPIPQGFLSDQYGFRVPGITEPKAPGTVRVAFLGGSTSEGGFHCFPERAIRLINAALRTNAYEMLNAACSGYSSFQSLRVLERHVLSFDPDVVFIYHGWNDLDCWNDGYSDTEKDRAARSLRTQEVARVWTHSRLVQLTGWFRDKADFSWPRPRLTPEQFRDNMRKMVRLCERRGIPVVIMLRPYSKKRRSNPGRHDPAMQRHFRVATPEALYDKRHEISIGVQIGLAREFRNVRLCDGFVCLNRLQEDQMNGLLPNNIPIFSEDGCHIKPYAEQKLAEEVALTLARKHENAVRAYLTSYEYYRNLAIECVNEDLLPEAEQYLRLARAVSSQPELLTIARAIDDRRDFVRLYQEARRWGSKEPFDSKVAKLKRCLAMRPNDLGVVLQIYALCKDNQRLELVAEAVTGFQPLTVQDHYEWLQVVLESHLAAGRSNAALSCAQTILYMDPLDERARDAVRLINQVPGSNRTARTPTVLL